MVFLLFEFLFPLDSSGPGSFDLSLSTTPYLELCVASHACRTIILSTRVRHIVIILLCAGPQTTLKMKMHCAPLSWHHCSLGFALRCDSFSCTINRTETQLKYLWSQLGTKGASEPQKAAFFLQHITRNAIFLIDLRGLRIRKGKTILFSTQLNKQYKEASYIHRI